jgi:hypothetical protein
LFLTEIDSRAAVKGSRDPLGLVPLWSHFGRHVVGNLTTVTGSVRGFTTTLLGYFFAGEAAEAGGGKTESELGLFLKFEQLAAYSRWAVGEDDDFRGSKRVKRRVGEKASLFLSAKPADQILSNQKVYGLWGLFSGPARASGLLERDRNGLSLEAREFVLREYVAAFNKAGFRDGRAVVDLLRQPRTELDLRRHRRLAEVVAGIHGTRYSPSERDFYWQHLRDGGPSDSTRGLQAKLAELLSAGPPEPFSRAELRSVTKLAACRGSGWDELGRRLSRIDRLESVLVPADAAFGFLMGRDRSALADVAAELKKEWGRLSFIDVQALRDLQAEIGEAFHDPSAGERWVRIGEALACGEYDAVLRLLLQHNGFVMGARGSDPWVRESRGCVEVRLREAGRELLEKESLEQAWVNNYFVNPLKEVVVTLGLK